MTLGELAKQKRKIYRKELYKKIMNEWENNMTLNEACTKCGITRDKFYYISKSLNVDNTKKSSRKQYGGKDENTTINHQYGGISLIDNTGTEVKNVIFSESESRQKKNNGKQSNILIGNFLDEKLFLPKRKPIFQYCTPKTTFKNFYNSMTILYVSLRNPRFQRGEAIFIFVFAFSYAPTCFI